MVVSLEKFFMKMIGKLKNKLVFSKYNAKHNATVVKLFENKFYTKFCY